MNDPTQPSWLSILESIIARPALYWGNSDNHFHSFIAFINGLQLARSANPEALEELDRILPPDFDRFVTTHYGHTFPHGGYGWSTFIEENSGSPKEALELFLHLRKLHAAQDGKSPATHTSSPQSTPPRPFGQGCLLLLTPIARGEISDAPAVMDLLTRCMEEMRAAGIDQWDTVYPSLPVVEADARARSLFLVRKADLCICSLSLDEQQPDVYAGLPWQDTTGRPLVVHRLAVHPGWRGLGIGAQLMAHAENFARENGFTSIRLDTYTGNPRALDLYLRRGYQHVGQVIFPRRQLPFECLEWQVPGSPLP